MVVSKIPERRRAQLLSWSYTLYSLDKNAFRTGDSSLVLEVNELKTCSKFSHRHSQIAGISEQNLCEDDYNSQTTSKIVLCHTYSPLCTLHSQAIKK